MIKGAVNQDGGDVKENQDDCEEDVILQVSKGATTLLITELQYCCDKHGAGIHE